MGGGLTTPLFSSSSSSRSLFLYSPSSSVPTSPAAAVASFRSRFQINYIVMRGTNSIIYHATDQQSNQSIALKRILFQKSNCEQVIQNSLNELAILRRIGLHEHIVNLYCAYQYSTYCYFVFTFLSGGDLRYNLTIHQSKKTPLTALLPSDAPSSQQIQVFDEQCVLYLVCCIGSALFHCHQKGIIHRDVKPENIGLDFFGRPYLLDFGISVASSEINFLPLSESTSGTLPYLAPEVLAPGNCHSYQIDFWSLGVVAYELFYQQRPFHPHCPEVAIEFVTTNYKDMWQQLKALNPLDHPPHVKTGTEDYCPFRSHSPHLNPTISFLPSHHPNNLPPPPPSPPSSPQSPLEEMTSTDSAFLSLLDGLLDVRIPQRLGNRTHFLEFSSHPSFAQYQYDYHPLNTRSRRYHDKPSPLAKHILPIYSLEHPTLAKNPIHETSALTSRGKALLSQFHYIRSSEEYREFHRACRDRDGCHGQSHVPSNME
jgi:serine/threonine protein kinase